MDEGTEVAVLVHPVVPAMQKFERSTPDCLDSLWRMARVDGIAATLPAVAMPNAAQRAELVERLAKLKLATEGRGLTDRFAQAMTAVLAVKAARGGGEATMAIRGAAYRAALSDVPESFVVAACEAALKAPSPFAPSPGEIRDWANKAMEPLRTEAYRIGLILKAKPIAERSKEERDLMKARFAEFMDEMHARHPVAKAAPPQADDLMTVCGPVEISDALRRQLSGEAGQG